MQSDDICAVILAGGRSRRMGFNKALISVQGKPLISLLIDRIRPLTERIFISSNDPSAYTFLNFPVLADFYKGQGPLAGFHSAMHQNECSLFLIIACDLPNLQLPILHRLISFCDGYDAAIPRTSNGIAHPLCAVYRRTCLPIIESSLLKGDNKVIKTFLSDRLSVRWITPDEGSFKDTDLANINTPEDLQTLSI